MALASIYLWKRENSDGTCTLKLRVTEHRKSKYISLGYRVKKEHWDEKKERIRKGHANSQRLNNQLQTKLNEAQRVIIELQDKEAFSFEAFADLFTGKGKKTYTFNEIAEEYLANLKDQGKYMRYTPDKARVKRFKEFLKDKDIAFRDITVSLLNQYKAWLKVNYEISDRSVVNSLIVIRTLFNQAIERGIVEQTAYPFGRNKIVIRFPETTKVGLSDKELKRLESYKPQTQAEQHALDVWFFSFYLAGMRISDVLQVKLQDIMDGRLYYTTSKNLKAISLPLSKNAQGIVSRYQTIDNEGFLFPDLAGIGENPNKYRVQQRIKLQTKKINTALKEIRSTLNLSTKLTMHISRHTFARLSASKIPIHHLQQLYRHSSISVTEQYMRAFSNQELDRSLQQVLLDRATQER